MKKEPFGQTKFGKIAYTYTFENEKGMRLTVSDLGATLLNLWVNDREGNRQDVVLGFDTLAAYEENTDVYFSATIGRSANRIAQAVFEIDGVSYALEKNDGDNHLHGGSDGYQLRLWQVKEIDEALKKITFTLKSPDLDQGYPGELTLDVTYQLTEDAVVITYRGQSDQSTIFNPTNHSYFNLNGHQSGSIEQHQLQIHADFFTPVKDAQAIPTGERQAVANTPMDFRQLHAIGDAIGVDDAQLHYGKGYDHNYVLNPNQPIQARLVGDQSGITMEMTTDLPGVQLYTGNFLANHPGKGGITYPFRSGVCLESQYFPNAINEPSFDSPLLTAGEEKVTTTTYRFV